jgi:hypothetical protein
MDQSAFLESIDNRSGLDPRHDGEQPERQQLDIEMYSNYFPTLAPPGLHSYCIVPPSITRVYLEDSKAWLERKPKERRLATTD